MTNPGMRQPDGWGPDGPGGAGMGPTPSGPAFLPSGGPPAPPRRPAARPASPPARRRPASRLPAVLTAVVVAVVALVVGGASFAAYWADTHVAAPAQPAARRTPAAQAPGTIEFTTSHGSGRLVLIDRAWVQDGIEPPSSGTYLRLQVELVCTEGRVDYGPYSFQAFDRTGGLYDQTAAGAGDQLLEVGRLYAGQAVRGSIAFDLPRGEVTLLMSDEGDRTVTALRVPD